MTTSNPFASTVEFNALQYAFFDDSYENNLETLMHLIKQTSPYSIIVAPELCLTNFSFTHMQKAAAFGQHALPKLLELSKERVIAFTMTEEVDGKFYNSAKILYQEKVIHSQPKVKLFALGEEDKHFTSGKAEDIKIIEIEGLKIALLICFEIRFITLWEKIQGADIILIPALWGKLRKEHYESITTSLAIINQAFVIASDSANDTMASSSGIITPFGNTLRDDTKNRLTLKADLKEIKKMRRYLDVGIA